MRMGGFWGRVSVFSLVGVGDTDGVRGFCVVCVY